MIIIIRGGGVLFNVTVFLYSLVEYVVLRSGQSAHTRNYAAQQRGKCETNSILGL